jgi:hypothetical protein
MFLKVEIKKGANEQLFAAKLMKEKEVATVKISKPRKKKKEPMSDYYANGKQLSVKEFKSRIAKAEKDVKEGRFITHEEMKKRWEEKKKKLTK